jgi:hypothetical protein
MSTASVRWNTTSDWLTTQSDHAMPTPVLAQRTAHPRVADSPRGEDGSGQYRTGQDQWDEQRVDPTELGDQLAQQHGVQELGGESSHGDLRGVWCVRASNIGQVAVLRHRSTERFGPISLSRVTPGGTLMWVPSRP